MAENGGELSAHRVEISGVDTYVYDAPVLATTVTLGDVRYGGGHHAHYINPDGAHAIMELELVGDETLDIGRAITSRVPPGIHLLACHFNEVKD